MKILFSANAMDKFGDGYDRHSILKYLRRDHEVTVDEQPRNIRGFDLFIGIVSAGCKLDPNVIKKADCKTITWCVDDGIRFNMYRKVMLASNHACTIDEGVIRLYPNWKNLHFLPPAADHEVCINKNIPLKERKHKISFVGNCSYPSRKEMIGALTEEFGDGFACYGWKSPQKGRNREYSFKEMVDIFNDTIINVDRTHHGVINNRAFDVPMCGGFLFSDAGADDNLVCYFGYHNLNGLVDSCRDMLRDYSLIDAATRAMNNRVKNHTWENRVKELLNIVK